MKILKFGGSSIATPERIKAVLEIISAARAEEEIAVVVSAFGGVTNKLIELSSLAASGDAGYKQVLSDLQSQHLEVVTTLIRSGVANLNW